MACRGCAWSLMDFAVLTADGNRLRDFLISHHVIAGVYFCDSCHQECRVDDRRQLFRCDRQETVKLHGGRTKVTKRHSFSKSLVVGSWFDRHFHKKLYVGFALFGWFSRILGRLLLNTSCLSLGKVWWIGVLFVARFVSFG